MRLRLNTNVPGHRYGAEVEASVLGDDFAQELLDNGQAELLEAELAVPSKLERYQIECFDLADRLEATAGQVSRVADLFAELDEDDKSKAIELFGVVYAPRPEFASPAVLALAAGLAGERPDLLAVTVEDGAITDIRRVPEVEPNTSGGASEASAADQVAASDADASSTDAVDASQPSDQAAGAEGASDGSDVNAPSTHTPPAEAGPSGDAAGATAPAADPADPAPAKPAAKSEGGAAKAKKPGG